jgi:hypothetical protein
VAAFGEGVAGLVAARAADGHPLVKGRQLAATSEALADAVRAAGAEPVPPQLGAAGWAVRCGQLITAADARALAAMTVAALDEARGAGSPAAAAAAAAAPPPMQA